jgi:CheY-like chemotaxis protein
MGIYLPVLDGRGATRQLKESDDTRGIPIITLTADAGAGDRETATEAGCDDCDTRPIALPRLPEKIGARPGKPSGS